MKKKIAALAITSILLANYGVTFAEPKNWRDQIIYFAMTDRFANGDKSNDNQHYGEYGDTEPQYNGGDLKGLAEKVDYIKGLGATAIWITPPVANQWWQGTKASGYGGYHGYWASNFKEVDKHLGTLKDYKSMVDTYHKKDMYVIQDIVVNHMGDFFTYSEEYNYRTDIREWFNHLTGRKYKNLTDTWQLSKGSVPVKAPTQKPFDKIDPNKYLKDAIYHFTPNVVDYSNEYESQNYQLSDLDDLNTENPVVVEALKDSYRYWIKNAGIDGYRIDTLRHVNIDFWPEFLYGTKKSDGIKVYAKKLGKDNFFTFGESFTSSNKYNGKFTKGNSVDSVLDFPMQNVLSMMYKKGKPTRLFTKEVKLRNTKNYKDPSLLVTFIDNHDMDRWLAGGNISNMKQALAIIMTIPGVPCIYYGTEQALDISRESMFKGGYTTKNKDKYDTKSEMYQYLKKIIALRKSNKIFRYGKLTPLFDNKVGRGIFAYKMTYQGKNAIMVYNTSKNAKVVNNLDTGLKNGYKLQLLISGTKDKKLNNVSVLNNGKTSFELGSQNFAVFMANKRDKSLSNSKTKLSTEINSTVDDLDYLDTIRRGAKFEGTASKASKIEFLIDGVPSGSLQSVDVVDEKWSYKIDFKGIKPGKHYLVLKALDDDGNYAYSKTYYFNLKNSFQFGWIIFGLLILAVIGYKVRDNYLTKKMWMEKYHVAEHRKNSKEDKEKDSDKK